MNPNNNLNNASPFVFTCPDKPSLPPDFQEFRQERKFTDINLKIDEEKFEAHRLVLAYSCPVLKTMLLDKWDPEKKEDCILHKEHVNPKIVDDLLDFIYTRKVTLTLDNAKLLCIAAEFLDIPTLKEGTQEYLKKQLESSPEYLFDWFNFASQYPLKSLYEACIKYVYQNHRNVLQGDEILAIPAELLLKLFNGLKGIPSDMISNESMFTLMIKWLKHDFTNRSDFMLDLLKCIPLVELSENFLKNIVNKEEIVVNLSASRQLIENALNEHSSDSQLSNLPATKKLKTSPSQNLYFFGGHRPLPDDELLNSVSCLDVSTGEWNQMTPMIFPRRGFRVTAIGEKVYVFGGFMDGKYSNIAEVFDTKRNRWTQLRPMPTARLRCSAVSIDGFIYVSGGWSESPDGIGQSLNSVDRYCVATNEWTSVASMLRPRYGHKLVLFNGSIYAIGGLYSTSQKHIIEKFDRKTDSWEETFETQLFSYTHDVIVCQNNFYVSRQNEFLSYDPLTNSFVYSIQELFNSSLALIGNKIWVIEHSDFDDYDNDDDDDDYEKRPNGNNKFYEFDPVTYEWEPLDVVIDVPRRDFQVIAIER